jgi:hypothetical protein
MTQEQELHLELVIKEATALIDAKYRAGQAAHGGDLFTKTTTELIDEAINECIDQIVYLLTAKHNLEKWKEEHGHSVQETHIRSVHDIPANKNLY